MTQRFTQDHVDTWDRDGGLVIERFFNAEEVAAAMNIWRLFTLENTFPLLAFVS